MIPYPRADFKPHFFAGRKKRDGPMGRPFAVLFYATVSSPFFTSSVSF